MSDGIVTMDSPVSEENAKWIVIEIKKDADGNVSVETPAIYDDRNVAESKFFLALSVAATSDISKHSVTLLHENGYIVRNETYYHE